MSNGYTALLLDNLGFLYDTTLKNNELQDACPQQALLEPLYLRAFQRILLFPLLKLSYLVPTGSGLSPLAHAPQGALPQDTITLMLTLLFVLTLLTSVGWRTPV